VEALPAGQVEETVVTVRSRDELLDQVVGVLSAQQAVIVRMGVRHAAVFGSVARGDNREDSDVDVMVEVDPAKVATIFDLGEIQQSLEEWLGRAVDVARRDRLRPNVAAEAEQEAIHAF
jgi:predicted nucleotidyltransferase